MASCNSQRIRGIDQEQVGYRDVSAPCKRLMITAEFLEPRSLPFPAAGPVLSTSRAPAYNRARHVLIDHWSCDIYSSVTSVSVASSCLQLHALSHLCILKLLAECRAFSWPMQLEPL